MKRILSLFLFLFCALSAIAQELPLKVFAQFDDPDRIANNIKNECDLPKRQLFTVMEELQRAGVTTVEDSSQVPLVGRYLRLDIKDAVSMGNAFTGHKKFVITSAKLFLNGQEVARNTFNRNSMGGAFAGFKGSCDVLNRCVDTISKDMVGWIKSNLITAAAESVKKPE